MRASEMAEFVARVRRLFGGQMDEELFTIAKERIAGLHAKPCNEALDEYALAHGGPRSRFIPAKFLEVYTRRTEKLDANAERISREAMKRKAAIGADLEAEQVSREWSGIRSALASMDPARRSSAVSALRSAGWQVGSDPTAWTDQVALAVHDIATEAVVTIRDQQTGEWNREVSALVFWTVISPRPSEIPVGASRSGTPRNPTDGTERRGEAGRAVSSAPTRKPETLLADDEIPF